MLQFAAHNVSFDNSKPDGQYKKTADNTILMSLHNDFKFTSISDGIKKSVAWFIVNYDLSVHDLNDYRHLYIRL